MLSKPRSPSKTSVWEGRYGPLLIAEIGGNHEGDFDQARRLVDLALTTGVDVIKFQVYYADRLVNPVLDPDRHAHFLRFELTPEQHIELANLCISAGVKYLASVWSVEELEWLDEYLDLYKIGSGDMTAYPLLQSFAERGKPIVLSTGLSTLDDVIDSVAFLRSINPIYEGPNKLAVLQCTSVYPLEKSDANLRAIDSLLSATGATVGYSDHTTDSQALLVAAARGASVLEFHFTDSREGKTFRDHAVSLTPAEVLRLGTELDELGELLGTGIKAPLPSEIATGHVQSFRRGAYFRHSMSAGSTVAAEDFVCLRPLNGLDPRQISSLVGRRLVRDVGALEPLDQGIVEAD